MRKIFLVCLVAASARADVILKADGGTATIGPVTSIACGVGMACTRSGTTGLITNDTQTYAAMTLYVDPLGSDSNSCTSSGTGACLTLAGAVAKLPRFIKHAVTVNVAAGTYAETISISGLEISSGVTMTVQGVMADVTPATGTTGGTLTNVALGTVSTPGIYTDSAQTWTVNDLSYKFITPTAGANSGISIPIYRNTATTLTVPVNQSSPGNVTYKIQTPATVFSAVSGTIYTGVGAGTLVFKNVSIAATLAVSGAGLFRIDTGVVGGITNSGRFAALRTVINSAGYGVVQTSTTGFAFSSTNNSIVRSTALSSAPLYITGGGTTVTTTIVESTSTQAGRAAIALITENRFSISSAWVFCSGVPGINGVAFSLISLTTDRPHLSVTSLSVDGCSTGLSLDHGTADVLSGGGLAFNNTTTAMRVGYGGSIQFNGITPTFTSVTNELSLDGTFYPFSFLTGLSAPQVMSNSYGSTIIR